MIRSAICRLLVGADAELEAELRGCARTRRRLAKARLHVIDGDVDQLEEVTETTTDQVM